jgi:chemotaxis protein histidine kinase CheA
MPIDPLVRPVLHTFVAEIEAIQQAVTRALLELERPDAAPSDLAGPHTEVARGLHTLKGTSSTFGLEGLSEVVHRLEDLLGPAPEGPMDPRIADAILQTLDFVLRSVREIHRGTAEEPDTAPMLARLARVASGAPDLPADAEPTPTPVAPEDASGFRVAYEDFVYLIKEAEHLRQVGLRLEDRLRQIDDVLETMHAGDAGRDALGMARTGMMFLRRALAGDVAEVSDVVTSWEEGLKVMSTVPVATALEPLRRAVRDQCRVTGKRASLAVVGGELSLDRRLLDALSGPLVQLVRNAVAHGIEPPDERDAAGKHAEGAVTIRLEQQGNLLLVEVSDDGCGLDLARVKQEAMRRGLASAEELGDMDARELHEFVFRSGFSTSFEITETSGRGVGLDIVRERLRSLQGQIDVLSQSGQGTRFLMTVPIELGSSPTLMLRVGETVVGLPMVVVESVVLPKRQRMRRSAHRTMFEHNGELVSIRDLGALLELREPQPVRPDQPVLVVQSHGLRAAIAVDEVVADRDLVIRPLPEELRPLRVYQGASVLARGEVLLVLRPEWLIESERERPAAVPSRRALVVDDSITARAMHRTVLESGGFVVHGSASAEHALEKLAESRYDVVVCDIRMEGMDGLAFVRAVRSTRALRDIPVLLVSVDDGDAAGDQAALAGADAFLTKKSCASGRLLAEVERVMRLRRRTA